MIRGTAQPFKFKLPCNFNELESVIITFMQENYNGPSESRPLPIVKNLSQCRQGSSSNELIVILNKEETLRFTDKRKAYVQIKCEGVDSLSFGSKKESITVYPVLNDSILEDNITPTPSPEDELTTFDGGYIIKRVGE